MNMEMPESQSKYPFWSMAWKEKWCTIEQLRFITFSPANKYGQITVEQFEKLTGEKY